MPQDSLTKMDARYIITASCLLAICIMDHTESHILAEDDFRLIQRKDLLAMKTDVFVHTETSSFSQLLFDVARDQVIVGAKDNLFRLSLRNLKELERVHWPAPPEKAKLCQDKGQSEDDCHNYVKILLSNGHRLFACGTNAFSPQCSWRDIEKVSQLVEWVSGVAKCPYSPRSNVTALMTMTGQYYVGTSTDFTGADFAIYRTMGDVSEESSTLRTKQYNSMWLNEPQFVGSFDDDKFVYFVFREAAVEYMNCGKVVYSRIARMCKNDAGGQHMLRGSWTTFVKARLNCSLPGEYPFYYDEVQSITYLSDERLLYVTFTTPSNGIAGSAVCVYNMSMVDAAFRGPFKHQEYSTSTWEPHDAQRADGHFDCQKQAGSTDQLIDSHLYQLMNDAVQPINADPLYTATLQRFTHISVDVTPTKYAAKQHIVFVATQGGDVIKLSVLGGFRGSCQIEVWRLGEDIENMQYLEETNSLYLGSASSVLRIPVSRCSRHSSRTSCTGSSDPYCGWDERRDVCSTAPNTDVKASHWAQSYEGCPTTDLPVDGGWTAWSDWEICLQEIDLTASVGSLSQDNQDKCLCKKRTCSNPKPINGGKGCEGTQIAVSNCTVHGGWTPWSAWSACSASCGIAVKTRQRWCASPPPAHGGRLCVGQDRHEIYCTQNPPCPAPMPPPRDGAWSAWSEWSACSGAWPCGGSGYKERRRACDSPQPAHGGADCDGLDVERQPCELKTCDYRRAAAWTPWVRSGNSTDGSHVEKRFKFLCKAQSMEQIKLNIAKEEERYCRADGLTCSITPFTTDSADNADSGDWSPWGEWGVCSGSCGGGQQVRSRVCLSGQCRGSHEEHRPCNLEPCNGVWSCWSEWSSCSAPCVRDATAATSGWRERRRTCLSHDGCEDGAAAHETQVCISPLCQESSGGWGAWGSWAPCETDGQQSRRRPCLAPSCSGDGLQTRPCQADDLDNEVQVLPSSGRIMTASLSSAGLSVGGAVGCAMAAFVAGLMCALAVLAWRARRQDAVWGLGAQPWRWRREPRVPSSPHYITAKPNTYVSVPLQDVPKKVKRQPSFTGTTSSGIVLSKSNNLGANQQNNTLNTPKLYPKAIAQDYDSTGTLKRHSHQHKNNVHPDVEKFY